MTEANPQATNHENRPVHPFLAQVNEIMDRHSALPKNNEIHDTFMDAFESIVEKMKPENQGRIMVSIQRVLTHAGGYLHEYGARISNFAGNVMATPLINAEEKFAKDIAYTKTLEVAKSWAGMAKNTSEKATHTREAIRDNFLATVKTGGLTGAVLGAGYIGMSEGAKIGLLSAGVQGALLGAGFGAAIGAATPLVMRLKDQLMGPPAMYWSLFGFFNRFKTGLQFNFSK